MRALLLAAGRGERLRPLTDTTPKCLVEVAGRPLLDHWLDRLLSSGCVDRVLVNTHYLSDPVRSHIAASWWCKSIDLVHERRLLGTGGTIVANSRWLRRGAFLVAHADNVAQFSVRSLCRAHVRRPPRCQMTMVTFKTDRPRECGILEVDRSGVMSAYEEKPDRPNGSLANAAVYIMEPSMLDRLAAVGETVFDFQSAVLPKLLGQVMTYQANYLRDIGTPETLALARRELEPA